MDKLINLVKTFSETNPNIKLIKKSNNAISLTNELKTLYLVFLDDYNFYYKLHNDDIFYGNFDCENSLIKCLSWLTY